MVKVILMETVESLGIIGKEVNVADGYARNYLLPRKKAVLATPQNRNLIEQARAKLELQQAKERETAEEMARRIEGVTCRIESKVSEEDRLYGSVSAREIAEALARQGIEVEKRMILLEEPIKALGAYQIPIRVYKDVKPVITVEVVPA
ncbi:MAG: 50S ribosomal protein L9 [Desulfobacterales bacterium]|nr:50S ribosomal protein L9 [Desulfobacterales bacterium]MDD3081131.1 50S ribosomal protein L9 [Desulfobacterales bacterium]MDD3950178.1 50S ribosomal protein L9 [Desulfobacterales bacterium]MDD4463520.1 50S ribosomal protein L9 [Desulfobacterales bacterium]MDY0377214.1 50S ribosomal protein L9 [Desulfobacterales bacterium]